MINVLICCYKAGDVLGYVLEQFVDVPEITRILIADGPHTGGFGPHGYLVDEPSVKEVVDTFPQDKIFYEWTDDCEIRPDKNNRILPNVTEDCEWVLNVDADEVYHEKYLRRLIGYLQKGPRYDRYCIQTVNPYPDHRHYFKIDDWKPRLYRYIEGMACPRGSDRQHQYILHPDHKTKKGTIQGMAKMHPSKCQIYHLNSIRLLPVTGEEKCRVRPQDDGTLIYKGGKTFQKTEIEPMSMKYVPHSIRKTLNE